MSEHEAVQHIKVGAIWRRKKTGGLVRIIATRNQGSDREPYYDIRWQTVAKPKRAGNSYQEYWLRNCEPTGEASDD